MGTRAVREQRFGISDLWRVPMEWVSTLTARFTGWLNQERWTNLLLIAALVVANLVILAFILQGQENRAIAFVVLALALPLAFLVPEVGIVSFILAGTGLFVNIAYYVLEQGTGERTLGLFFLMAVSVRALYEYLKTPAHERPRLLTPITIALLVFWVYYMVYVAYIYLFQYNEVPADSVEAVLGIYRPGLFRHFDSHILWIGMLSLLILLRDWNRTRRVLFVLGVMMFLGAAALVWEYLAPLPPFFKILFQLRAAGESVEGYRVREPGSLYFFTIGLFFALYLTGYLRSWRNALSVTFIIVSTFAILITKNRILWAGLLLFLPMALLWKPPQVLIRQLSVVIAVALVGMTLLLQTQIRDVSQRIVTETIERWTRNYAYGGDPRLDPSYQARIREREAWESTMKEKTLAQKLFGSGLQAGYGRYITLFDVGIQNPRFTRIYVEKVHMHFAWLARIHRIGVVGTAFLIILILVTCVRAVQAFFSTHIPYIRALVVGVVGATIGMLFFDSIHEHLHRPAATPVVLMWIVFELIFHWKRTGQLEQLNSARSSVPNAL